MHETTQVICTNNAVTVFKDKSTTCIRPYVVVMALSIIHTAKHF